jgi:diguanylate cyclase (GGDEF)-like protein
LTGRTGKPEARRAPPIDVAGPRDDAAPAASEQAARNLFWRRHARLGVALSLASIAVLVVYMAIGTQGDRRTGLLVLAASAAALTIVVGLATPHVVGRSWDRAFFLAWSLGVVAVILAGAALDHGEESPITVTLYLPLLYAALAYGPLPVFCLGIAELAGYLLVAWRADTSSTARTTLFGTTLLLASLMATRAARNRENMSRQLRDLTTVLHTQALHDSLTGCLNRRGFDNAVDAEIARAQRYRRPASLLLVDVDGLKQLNDEHGHAVGDRALVHVANALSVITRRADVTARLGGDEFAVLAPETRVGEAAELAGRLHAALRDDADGVHVTVSVGIASLGLDNTGVADLLRRADVALYDAKTHGRDRTAVFGRPSHARTPPSSDTIPHQRQAGGL